MPRAFAALFSLLGLLLASAGNVVASDTPSPCGEAVCCCVKRTSTRTGKYLESRNFRIHYSDDAELPASLIPVCEKSCQAVRERWLSANEQARWTPKCDVYLYRSGREFERRTQAPASLWGFTELSVGEGKVWSRTLHMRIDNAAQLQKVLAHELTHVVLADRFTNRPIPRWADEGVAVLCEPIERRRALAEPLAHEARQRRLLPLRDMTRLQHLPEDERQGELFYGASGAFIEFLIEVHHLTEPQVLSFVEDCNNRGWDRAAARQFPKTSAARLESEWREWIINRPQTLLADDGGSATADSAASMD